MVKFEIYDWYEPHYTPSIPQQAMLSKQTLSKVPTELEYVERSVSRKEVKTQILWTFETRTREGINFSIWIIVILQQRDRRDSQNINADKF